MVFHVIGSCMTNDSFGHGSGVLSLVLAQCLIHMSYIQIYLLCGPHLYSFYYGLALVLTPFFCAGSAV